MRVFAIMMAMLGVFVYLLFHFSFWAAFGGMYMIGMVVVALLACIGRRQPTSQLTWNDAAESEQVS